MNMKKRMYRETAYVLAMIILSLGTALMERADFGISMVVAPSYLLHLKVSQSLPWFSFGVAEYLMQTLVLVLLMLCMRRVKLAYFFAFVSAMLSGVLFDSSSLYLLLTYGPMLAICALAATPLGKRFYKSPNSLSCF